MSGRATIIRCVLLATMLILAAGCALLSPPRPEPAKAVLSELPDAVPHGRLHLASLLVLPTEASPAFDTVRMAYSEQPYQLAYFRDHEWADPPPAMIQKAMVQTLRQTGAFRTVRISPEADRSDYTLRSELQSLVQDYTRTPPVLKLSMRIELAGPSGHVLASREFVEQEPMRERKSYAGVLAANTALARVLRAIAEMIVEQPR